MIIFFIRRYNDVDHLVPVIDSIAETNISGVSVYSINPDLNIHDFRLEYLSEKYGIEIKPIHHEAYLSGMSFFLRLTIFNPEFFKISRSIDHKFINKFLSYAHKVLRKLYGPKNFDKAIKKYFDIEWCTSFLRKNNATAVAFDWIKKDQHIAGNLMDAAKNQGIKIFALPHGLNIMTTDLITWNEVKQGSHDNYSDDFNLFDHFVVNNANEKRFYQKRGLPEEKINVLGSPRFSRKWREKYKKLIIEKKALSKKENKINVVYFEHSYHYRGFEDKARYTIDKLKQLDFIDLVIKPHTRSNKTVYTDLGKYISDKQSYNLIKWCDVAIGVTSSIFIDVILEKKAFILPKYFTSNTTLYEEFGVCWEVETYKELEQALSKISQNPNVLPYNEKEIESFMESSVYNFSEDVLSDYNDLLLGLK